MKVARLWCLILVWPASLKPGSFRVALFSLCVSWSTTTVALFLMAICSRTSSLVIVSPSTLICRIARLSADKSVRPDKDAWYLRH